MSRAAAHRLACLAVVLLAGACTPPEIAPAVDPATSARADHALDDRARAHGALARQLRHFPIARTVATRSPRSQRAIDDEALRLGAFWKARADTHHFDAGFHARAGATLAARGRATAADAALRRLAATATARRPAWQALVDYNRSERMREDGGDGGRRLLPGAIAAIDALEAATLDYLDAVGGEPAPH